MKKHIFFLLGTLVFAPTWAQVTNPTPFNLSGGNWTLTGWRSNAPALHYPGNGANGTGAGEVSGAANAHMVFHQTVQPEPPGYNHLSPGTKDWNCAYNLTSRSRIMGLGTNGFSFLGTSDARDNFCNASGTNPNNYVGGALLALNTTGRSNIQVTWTGRTMSVAGGSPPRIFTIQLQYRIGNTGNFTDVPGSSYTMNNTAGHSAVVGPVTLPAVCNNQCLVQLRWIYYQSSSTGTGTRPELAVDDITVSSSPLGTTPNVAHSFSSPPPLTASLGDTDKPIYQVDLNVTGNTTSLCGASFTTGGTYAAADITGFKLRYSSDATLDPTDPVLAVINTSTGPGQILNFTGFTQSLTVGTHYLFVTMDVSSCATVGNTIHITSTPLSNFTYSTATTSGTPSAGSSYTFSIGAVPNVTGLTATPGNGQVTLNWTNPTCFSDVLIVAHTATITGSPTATSYTFNTNYSLAPSFTPAGKVVYQGTASTQTITGLSNGTEYFFKVFVRNGTLWSSGVEVKMTPWNGTAIFSVGSGLTTAAIWSNTRTGTPGLAAFNANTDVVIQNGHWVQMGSSPIDVRDLIVESGGRLWRGDSTNTSNMRYWNIHGDLICDGIIGNMNNTDMIGFNIETASCIISGTGHFRPARIRKNTTLPSTSTVNINMNATLRFPGTTIYNNTNFTNFNVNIGTGVTVQSFGNVSIDGINGLSSGERGGTITVNGTLNIFGAPQDTLFLVTNNTNAAYPVGFVINPGGVVNANHVQLDNSSPQFTTFSINGSLRVWEQIRHVAGSITSYGTGSVVLKSTPTATAFYDNFSSGLSGNWTAPLTVERSMADTYFGYMSSPVNNLPLSDWQADIGGSGWNGLGSDGANMIFDASCTYLDPNSPFANILQLNEADITSCRFQGWEIRTSGQATNGRGYAVNIPTAGLVVNATGTPNNGPVTFSGLTSSANPSVTSTITLGTYPVKGVNMLGNPYPSNIGWDQFRASHPTLSNVAYLYKGGNWISMDATNGADPNVIGSSQAFQVITPVATSVTFQNSHRLPGLTASFFSDELGYASGFKIRVLGNSHQDETTVYFDDNGRTNAYDFYYDGVKFENGPGVPNLFTRPAGSDMALSINALPASGFMTPIPLGCTIPATGTYVLEFSHVETTGLTVTLEDTKIGVFQVMNTQPTYSFTAQEGDHPLRFLIHLEAQHSVASTTAEESLFKAIVTPSGIQVHWGDVSGLGRLALTDLAGRTLWTRTLAADPASPFFIDTATLPSGVYILTVSMASGSQSTRLVIAH
ncbi:MAG: T9SS type A sorting domain-containing protein [Flavobacteriales bacterium]|nr:T9SS type A sorting domain-containing protein [Flavobacteriales bacterium]